jgi:hypothetical protein
MGRTEKMKVTMKNMQMMDSIGPSVPKNKRTVATAQACGDKCSSASSL